MKKLVYILVLMIAVSAFAHDRDIFPASNRKFYKPATGVAHALLSPSHSDTTTDAPTRGSIIYGNSTPAWDELAAATALGTSATHYLGTDGTDVGYRTTAQVADDIEGDIDHGGLAGLGDQLDHTWALYEDGTNPLTGNWSLGGFNLTSVGNITGSDVDVSAGMGSFTGSGTSTFGQIIDSGLTASLGVYTDGSKQLTSTAPSSGVLGYWTRAGTTIDTANSGDNLNLTGTLGSGAHTITPGNDVTALTIVQQGSSISPQIFIDNNEGETAMIFLDSIGVLKFTTDTGNISLRPTGDVEIGTGVNILGQTDGGFNIGAAGANRPANIWAKTDITAGGVFLGSDGVFNAVTYGFTSDPDTGMWLTASDQLAFSHEGSIIFQALTTGILMGPNLDITLAGTGTVTTGTGGLDATSGNIRTTGTVQGEHLYSTDDIVADGNIELPTTTANEGQILINSSPVFHTYTHNLAPAKNIFIGGAGNFTLHKDTLDFEGSTNLGIGLSALDTLTHGYYNFGLGTSALTSLTTGNSNVAVGQFAGFLNIVGCGNLDMGRSAGFANLGSFGIHLGYFAGRYNTLGNRLIIDSLPRANAPQEITNAILYGIMASTPASQSLRVNAALNVWGSASVGDGTNETRFSAAGNITQAGTAITTLDQLYLNEITTPTPIADDGAIYTKTDNHLYFQDGDGDEHLLHGDGFSNIWFHSISSVEVGISAQDAFALINSFTVVGHEDDLLNVVGNTATNTLTLSSIAGGEYEVSYHGSITATGGSDKEMVFALGIILATPKDITNVTDDTITPIVITSVGHGLENGDMVQIVDVIGNTAAKGSFIVDSKADDTFVIVALDGNPTTGNGDYNEASPTGDVSIVYPGNMEVHRMVRGADFGSISATGLHVLADSDTLSVYVANLSGVTNLTVSSISFSVFRIGD